MKHHRSDSTLIILCALLFLFASVNLTQSQRDTKKPTPLSDTNAEEAAALWPQVITNGSSTLTIYQPQLDR